MSDPLQARLTIVAEFPEQYFLENLAVRADGSILVTAMNTKELWCVPSPDSGTPVQPYLVHTFDLPPLCVVEVRPDVFLIGASDVYGTRLSRLYHLDLNGWTPGQPVDPTPVLEFPDPKVGLNGACLIAPDVLLVAGVTDLIWRVDLAATGLPAAARVWLQHDNMKNRPGEKKPEQPGVNGLRYDDHAGFVYYTSTSQQMFMRVKVDLPTLDPADLPEFIAGGREWDDFIIDRRLAIAYATTHRENTIDRVVLKPDGNRDGRKAIAGLPFDERLVGPSSGAWRRGPDDEGRAAYFTTDGGTADPPLGVFRTAKLLLVEFASNGQTEG